MNMTIVLVSKRTIGLHLLFVGLLLLLVNRPGRLLARPDAALSSRRDATGDDLPEAAKALADESRELDDDLLESMAKDFGQHIKATMENEMDKLIDEVESSPASPTSANSAAFAAAQQTDLANLKDESEKATEAIKTRIGLVADTTGALPQGNMGKMASSLLATASGRLQEAGAFVNDKMRALGNYVGRKVPNRLRRFFRWPSFMNFKIRHHKSYKSLREEVYRQMLFLKTQVIAGIQRVKFLLRRDTYLLTATQFADWTKKEYHDTFDNKQAESESDQGQFDSMSPADRSRLEALAKSGKTIFGQPIPEREDEASGGNKKRISRGDHDGEATKRRRAKRDADDDDDDDDDDYDELNETEDEMDVDFGLDQVDTAQDEDDFKILEEYSNADLSDLDDIENIVDEALAQNSGFKPIDLRETGCIIEPENQGSCGNCYAQVTVAAATYYNCMASQDKKLVRFHSRFTSDCGKYLTAEGEYPKLNGCNGGRMSQAYNFSKIAGLMRFPDYQTARCSYGIALSQDICAYPRPQLLAETDWRIHRVDMFQRTKYTTLKLSEVDLHLRTIGPVWVNVRIWDDFDSMGKGIYNRFDDKDRSGLHSMLIVGHDRDSKGRDYWIIWNSHGKAWGDQGFLRIYNESLSYFAAFYAGLVVHEL